jgi:hypothetical protein
MKRSMVVMAVFLGLSLMACGGTMSDAELEPGSAPERGEESTVSQFATCTAVCSGGGSVSCTGTPCSSADGQGVTCNGVFTPCPAAGCTGLPACSSLANTRCYTEGEIAPCCAGSFTSDVTCSMSTKFLVWQY